MALPVISDMFSVSSASSSLHNSFDLKFKFFSYSVLYLPRTVASRVVMPMVFGF
jgi:hypothetical protein